MVTGQRSRSSVFDRALRDRQERYDYYREKDAISEAQVRFVSPGTFRMVREALVAKGASPQQLKVPRVLKDDELIRMVQSRVV